jgi:transposase
MKSIFGVDMSMQSFEVAIDGEERVIQIANTMKAIRVWLKQVPAQSLIGVESTGHYHRLLVRAAIAAGHTVYVLNARDLSHYASALGRRAKTDRLDALMIARYLKHEHERLFPYTLPSALQEQLDELIARRHGIVVAHGALRASLKSATTQLKCTALALKALKKLIAEIDAHLQDLTSQDPALATHAAHLQNVVGFGPLVSISLAHALTRRAFKNDDAFIAYVGIDPKVRDSGHLKGRRILSKRGPAEYRRLLFLAAMAACKTALWKPFYQRYRQRGLSTIEALVILARKLARVAFAIVKNNIDFDPNRIKIACAQP